MTTLKKFVLFLRARRIHQPFEDPPPETVGDYQSRLKVFRQVRDQIHEWLIDFIEK